MAYMYLITCRLMVLQKVQQSANTLVNHQLSRIITQLNYFKNVSLNLSSGLSRQFSSWELQYGNGCLFLCLDRKRPIKNFQNCSCQHFSSTVNTLMRKPMPATVKLNFETQAKDTVVQVFDTTDKLIGKMTLAKAQQVAKQDDLKLMDIGKNPDKVQCFKMITGKQLFEENMKQKSIKKTDGTKKEKEFRIKINISDHDLEIKLNQIKALMKKGVNAKVVVRRDRKTTEEEANQIQSSLMKKITTNVQDLATVKKASKTTNDLIFVLRAISESGI